MKTRLHDQFMRFRLDESDVQELCERGSIRQDIIVGAKRLRFAITLTDERPSADLLNQSVEIKLPGTWTNNWSGNEVVGFDFDVSTESGIPLRIVVEKDFPCAHTADGRAVFGRPERMN